MPDGTVPNNGQIATWLNGKIHIYENLIFVFNNSQSATLNISDIDNRLYYAKGLIGFCTEAGTPILAMRNAARTAIAISYISGTHTGNMHANIIAFY